MAKARQWLERRLPEASEISHQEIWLSTLSAFIAIALVALISRYFVSGVGLPLMVASMGAAAVLLCAVPTSPMAQPWPLVGGHLVSAAIGVTCYRMLPDPVWAGAVAVSVSIFAMLYLRCLHPPGGAAALVAVVGGPEIHALGFNFLLAPVGLNVAVLLGVVYATNRSLLRRRLGAGTDSLPGFSTPAEEWQADHALSAADIRSALQEVNTYVDVTTDDLGRIFSLAMLHAQERRLAGVVCRDIMRPAVTAEFATELEEVWPVLQRGETTGIPVIDRARRVVGIVTIHDFLRHVDPSGKESLADRMAHFIRRTPGLTSEKPEVAGQVMTSPVITARDTDKVVDIVSIFTQRGIHHMPVTDEAGKLVGMLSWSDVMAVLERTLP